jgi:UDP-N-acetyl-2-amino-2-deoxyglucuronate dehydrogenase
LIQSGIGIDAVAIASPNGPHQEQALQVLENNWHEVLEKLTALTKSGCKKAIFKALQKHKKVFCVMQNRYSPLSVWLKAVLDSGILGKIFMVKINCYLIRDDRYYKPGAKTGKPSN